MKNLLTALLLVSWVAASVMARDIPGVQVETLAKSSQTWDGTALPAYPTRQPEITVLKYRIEPGAKLPLHHHPVINVAYLIKGELRVTTEKGLSRDLKAGDAVIELVDQLHFGENKGREVVELVVFYAGTEGQKLTLVK